MNESLLRSKMALFGDYNMTCLISVLNLDKQPLLNRFGGKVDWRRKEIVKIAKHYQLTNDEIVEVFELRGE